MSKNVLQFTWQRTEEQTEVYFCLGQTHFSKVLSTFADGSNPFLIVDSNVERYWNELISSSLKAASGSKYILDAAEERKTLSTLEDIWKSMSAAGIKRDTPVIVVGGGLTCDIGAFAASTYLRGLPLILIPTSLLCMVDA